MTLAAIWTGGINHPFEAAAPALGRLLADAGFVPFVSTDLDAVLDALAREPDALLVVYALRWSMTQHERYAPFRADWAFTTPPRARVAIPAHVASGGGLLALHTATICFDDWDGWRRLLGGGWAWGRSHHPPLGPVRVRPVAHAALARGLAEFELVDEVYAALDVHAGSTPELHAEARVPAAGDASVADGWQPVAWSRSHGRGRVVVDALGHDAAALEQPLHRRFLARAARWAAGRSESAESDAEVA